MKYVDSIYFERKLYVLRGRNVFSIFIVIFIVIEVVPKTL